MDTGAWWAMVHRVAKSWTQLSNLAHNTYLPWAESRLFLSCALFPKLEVHQGSNPEPWGI